MAKYVRSIFYTCHYGWQTHKYTLNYTGCQTPDGDAVAPGESYHPDTCNTWCVSRNVATLTMKIFYIRMLFSNM